MHARLACGDDANRIPAYMLHELMGSSIFSARARLKWYFISVGTVGAAILLNLALGTWIWPNVFPPFLIAVLFCSRYGGKGPGLTATALSSMAGFALLIEEDGLPMTLGMIAMRLTMFASVEVLIVYLMVGRTKTYEALRESEGRYRAVADHIYDWEYWQAPDGKLIYCSPSCERLSGYKSEEYLGDSKLLSRIVHPDDAPRWDEHFNESFNSFEICSLDFRIITRQGETRWIAHACTPVYAKGGGLLGRRACNRDITQPKRVEQSLRESQEQFQRALESIPDVLVIYDRDLRIQYVNNATCQLTGRPVTDYIGKRDEEVWPPEVYKAYLSTLRESFQARAIRSLETDVLLPGIGTRCLRITYVPLLDEKWQVREILGIAHDLTEGKAHEREIERLNRLNATLSAVNHSIILVQTREELFQEVCRIVVDQAGFKVVWVGWCDTESHRVHPVAQAGDSQGYVDKIKVYADDRPRAAVPWACASVKASRASSTILLGDPRAEPWREAAMAHGLQSVAALPIRLDGRVVGALIVYSGEKDRFRDKEVALLEEVAASISFALDHLEQERKRRQSEESLRDSQAKLKAIVNTAIDAIITIDFEGAVLSFNPAAERIFGFAAQEILGRSMCVLMPSPYREEHDGYLTRYKETGLPRVIGSRREIPGKRKDGTVFPMEIGVSEITVDGDRIFVGILRDITERKKAQEEIRSLNESLERRVKERTAELERVEQQKHRLAEILEASPDLVGMADPEGRVLYLNRAFSEAWDDRTMESRCGSSIATRQRRSA